MLTKSGLAILLSKLKRFEKPRVKEEQYETDSETAAAVLWQAYMNDDVKDKTVADLGCGTGILGLGAVLLKAKKVYMVEKDANAIGIAKENARFLEKENKIKIMDKLVFINQDIKGLKLYADIIIQNPPFGVKQKHADKTFLEKAFNISDVVYSLHKIESAGFIEQLSRDFGFFVTNITDFEMPIKACFDFHRKRIHRIKIGCWRLQKG